jgi:hypothetical protein
LGYDENSQGRIISPQNPLPTLPSILPNAGKFPGPPKKDKMGKWEKDLGEEANGTEGEEDGHWATKSTKGKSKEKKLEGGSGFVRCGIWIIHKILPNVFGHSTEKFMQTFCTFTFPHTPKSANFP